MNLHNFGSLIEESSYSRLGFLDVTSVFSLIFQVCFIVELFHLNLEILISSMMSQSLFTKVLVTLI